MPIVIPDKIPCEHIQQLEFEFSTLRDALSVEETEETWDSIARALARFSAVVKGGGYKYEKELINGIKASTRPIVGAMNSERTRLSAAALDCIIIIAPRIGLAFETLVPLFVPHILRLATRTNKVYVTRSQAGLSLILGYCQIPSIIPCLLAACKESKIVTGRAVAVEGVLRCLNKWDWTQQEVRTKVGEVEEVIRVTGRDKDAGVRQISRKVFEAYKTLFPERVEEFTGPMTPVMRKYLAIKPQTFAQSAMERARSPSVREKYKRPPIKPDLASSTSAVPSATSTSMRIASGTHTRSASSNAVVESSSLSTASSRSRPLDSRVVARNMPPPASIPLRARSASRPRTQHKPNGDDQHQTQHPVEHERHRVLSAASSTFSVKSAPSNPRPPYEHRPPVRLAASQSHTAGVNHAAATSSGQARRVRQVVAVEPHPANRPDLFAMAHKAPVRPTPLPGEAAPRAPRPNRGPGREAVGTSDTGVAFPTSEPTTVERKGAQRVPKLAQPPPAPNPAPSKADRPVTAMSDGPRREVKPSMFRRGAPGTSAPPSSENKSEKQKHGFVPRRGGGVMQPTLSQLSKQKALASANAPITCTSKMVIVSNTSKRPVWGTGSKQTITKAIPPVKLQSRACVAKVVGAKQGDQAKETAVRPEMVPLPASPPREPQDLLQPMSIPGSPKALQNDEEEALKTTPLVEATATDAPEGAEESTESETGADGTQTEEAQDLAQDTNDENVQDAFTDAKLPAPQTPPYPATDEEGDESELEDIEFETGDAYDPAGMPIKMPHKVVDLGTNIILPARNPLGEVVINL